MDKKLIALTLAFSTIISTGVFKVSAYANFPSSDLTITSTTKIEDDQVAIKEVVKGYFDAKYKMKSILATNEDLSKYYSKSDNAKEALAEEKELLETEIEHNKLQISDLRYKEYTYNLDYKTISLKDNKAFLTLMESNSIYFNSTPDVKSQMADLLHNITFEKVNQNWYIIKDDYYNEYKTALSEYKTAAKTSMSSKSPRDLFIEDTKKQVEEIKKLQNTPEARRTERDKTTLTSSLKSYDWYSAVSYARQHALSPNSAYTNYETMGGDCTNFVSQCIHSGGIPFDTSGSNTWYWYSDSNRAPSWTSASNFHNYAVNNNSSSSSNTGLWAVESNWASMYQGDVVQLGSTAYHSMFISQVVYDSSSMPPTRKDYLICQHSTSSSGRLKDYPLSSKPTPSHYLSIKGYY